jgi:uncharacterized protein (TIGR02099 family)
MEYDRTNLLVNAGKQQRVLFGRKNTQPPRYMKGFVFQIAFNILHFFYHLFILAIIIIGLSNFWLPLIAEFKYAIEQEASSYLDAPVSFEEVLFNSDTEDPQWLFKNIRLQDKDKEKTLIELEKLTVSLDLIESLRTIRLQPDKVIGDGGHFSVIQDKQGVFRVDGLKLPLKGFNSGAGRNTALELDLAGVDIHWINEESNRRIDFNDTRLTGAITPLQVIANMSLKPPSEVGTPINLETHLFYTAKDQQQPEKPQMTSQLQWDGYFKVSGAIKHLQALPLDLLQLAGLKDAKIKLDGEGIISNGKVSSLQGDFLLADALWRDAEETDMPIALNGKWLSTHQGWTLSVDIIEDASIEIDHAHRASIDLVSKTLADQSRLLTGNIDQLNLSRYFPMLEKQSWLQGEIKDYLAHLKPRGELQELDLTLKFSPDDDLESVIGRGELINIGIDAYEAIPAVKKLNATLNFSEEGGDILFSSKASSIDFPDWLSKPILIDDLDGKLALQKQQDHWLVKLRELHFSNQDIHVQGKMELQLGGADDLNSDIEMQFKTNQTVTNVPDYIPSVISPMGREWLNNSILEGNVPSGEMKITGNLRDLPFDRVNSGSFYVGFDVEDSKIIPIPGWSEIGLLNGRVEFIDGGMLARVDSGEINGQKISNGTIKIPTFRKGSWIEVEDINVEGKLAPMVEVVEKSPLSRSLGKFFDDTSFAGNGNVSLNVFAAFGKEKREKEGISVDIALDINNGEIRFSKANHAVENIKGRIFFTEKGLSADSISASYRKSPARISVKTSKDHRYLDFKMSQENDTHRLLDILDEEYASLLKPFLSGDIKYQADLRVPSYSEAAKKAEKSLKLHFNSDVKGMQNLFPEPFGKYANTDSSLVLDIVLPFKDSEPEIYKLTYDDHVQAIYEKDSTPGLGIQFGAMDIALDKAPSSGIQVDGMLVETDLLAWLEAVERLKTGKHTGSSGFALPLNMNLGIERLFIGTEPQGSTSITTAFSPLTKAIHATLDSRKLDAQLNLNPKHWDIHLHNLNIDQFSNKKTTITGSQSAQSSQSTKMPAQVPSLNLLCTQCTTSGLGIKRMYLEMPKSGNNSSIRTLEIEGEAFSIQAKGGWNQWSPTESGTHLEVEAINIPEPEKLFASLGNGVGITGGNTNISGNLNWPGSPAAFSLAKLRGNLFLKTGRGSLPDVDPGAGKLLGLLNFSHLGRRLQLNFRDVSSKGTAFDEISGNVKFDAGILKTENIIIKSSVMLAGIKGESNLVRKTHDQTITVIPDIKSALPVVGIIFGGVGIGAAVAVLDKVTDENEHKQLERENVGMRYKITGSWDDPKVDEVKPINNDDVWGEDEIWE